MTIENLISEWKSIEHFRTINREELMYEFACKYMGKLLTIALFAYKDYEDVGVEMGLAEALEDLLEAKPK